MRRATRCVKELVDLGLSFPTLGSALFLSISARAVDIPSFFSGTGERVRSEREVSTFGVASLLGVRLSNILCHGLLGSEAWTEFVSDVLAEPPP
mmetsp:Transcript_58255/g.102011  ORF Transcript_58255/g.102011 Transcript_58255/m.102011 type:complete len:94 (-) Transcript_58255:1299-1580(-)